MHFRIERKKRKKTMFDSILEWKGSVFFNPSFHIIGVTIFLILRDGETDADQRLEKYGKRLVNSVFIRTLYKPWTTSEPSIQKLELLNCMQLDKGFYPKVNNIAKVSVNTKVFVFFHGVCSFVSSPMIFFHKARAWIILSLGLKCRKARTYFCGVKEWAGLDSVNTSHVG